MKSNAMDSRYSDFDILRHSLNRLSGACEMVLAWNDLVESPDFYLESPQGLEKLAATCMMLESIGEGIKKIDRLRPGFLEANCPDIPWRSIMGLRDHIAHGYFDIDAEIIFDIVKTELKPLNDALRKMIS